MASGGSGGDALSIPSFIPQISTNDSSDYGENHSIAGDSLISEMTLMTYSDEKATIIKDEFFRRLKEQLKAKKHLTLQEKQAILKEVQDEQEIKFRRQDETEKDRNKFERKLEDKIDEKQRRREMQQQIQKIEQDGVSDFFERLYKLRSKEQDVEEKQVSVESAQLPRSSSYTPPSQSFPSNSGLQFQKSTSFPHQAQSSFSQGNNNGGRDMSILQRSINSLSKAFGSNVTLKRGNNNSNKCDSPSSRQNFSWDEQQQQRQEPRSSSSAMNNNLTKLYHPKPKSKQWGNDGDTSSTEIQDWPRQKDQNEEANKKLGETARTESSSSDADIAQAHIDDIIELKLVVANQQATIDTLSSKLHNLELANRCFLEKEQAVIKLLGCNI